MKNLFLTVVMATVIALGSNELNNQKLKKERNEILESLKIQQTQNIFEAENKKISVDSYLASENEYTIENELDLSQIGDQEVQINLYAHTTQGEKVSKTETLLFRVEDTIAPSIKCEDLKIYEGEKPEYQVEVSDTHCDVSYYIDDSAVDYNTIGEYKACVTATDECGNSSDITFNITVMSKNKIWYINTVNASSFGNSQSVIDAGQTASVVSVFGEKWVFKHAHQGGAAWYEIKVGDTLVIDDVSYIVTLSQTAEQPTSRNLYLNGVDIFAAETVSAGHKIIMKTCYSGTTNWVVTAD